MKLNALLEKQWGSRMETKHISSIFLRRFFSVYLCRYVERVRGVVDTSNATMVNSPEEKDVS